MDERERERMVGGGGGGKRWWRAKGTAGKQKRKGMT